MSLCGSICTLHTKAWSYLWLRRQLAAANQQGPILSSLSHDMRARWSKGAAAGLFVL